MDLDTVLKHMSAVAKQSPIFNGADWLMQEAIIKKLFDDLKRANDETEKPGDKHE